jgi:hypothetical protein
VKPTYGRMRKVLVSIFGVIAYGIATLSSGLAQTQCPTVADEKLPTCSYSATNGNCKVTINRMNPVTPPTIYVKRGYSVKVIVCNPSPLEDLTLDWKSSATVIPPDTFQTAFGALSGNLGKFTAIELIRAPSGGPFAKMVDLTQCEKDTTNCDNAPAITNAQQRVMSELRKIDALAISSEGLTSVKNALQPLPVGADCPKAWCDTANWKTEVAAQLKDASDAAEDFDKKIKLLALEIEKFVQAHTDSQSVSEAAVLDKNQASLNARYDPLAKVAALIKVVKDLPNQGKGVEGNAVIKDSTPGDKNYETQTWAVDYTNKLMATAKRVAGDTLKSENAALLSGLADPSPKTPLVTITVQFQSPSRFEVSTGLMVPLTPYHSYGKAAVAKNGVVTDNIVQETKTYTVVPAVFVNYRLWEWIPNKQRSALFATGGVGYNPTSTSVEFGAGMTYSYRSIAVSFVADIGRDTKLTGGFTVGQSLGTGNAANPPTSMYWSVKPAIAISVRIPLGGSSSSK